MLNDLFRLLSNVGSEGGEIDHSDLMLVTKFVPSTEQPGKRAHLVQLVAVQDEPEFGILETHHSVIVLEDYYLESIRNGGMESVEFSKLLDKMYMDLESKFRQHRTATIEASKNKH